MVRTFAFAALCSDPTDSGGILPCRNAGTAPCEAEALPLPNSQPRHPSRCRRRALWCFWPTSETPERPKKRNVRPARPVTAAPRRLCTSSPRKGTPRTVPRPLPGQRTSPTEGISAGWGGVEDGVGMRVWGGTAAPRARLRRPPAPGAPPAPPRAPPPPAGRSPARAPAQRPRRRKAAARMEGDGEGAARGPHARGTSPQLALPPAAPSPSSACRAW